jgi:hypothetical protein
MFPVYAVDFMDRLGHFAMIAHNKAGDARIDDVWQRSGRICHDRRSAGDRLHRHQRTGFRNEARHQQTTRRGQKAAFANKADMTQKAHRKSQPRLDLCGEIALVRFLGKDLAGNYQRNLGQGSSVDRLVKTFLRAYAAQSQCKLPFCVTGLQLRDGHTIGNLRQHRIVVPEMIASGKTETQLKYKPRRQDDRVSEG